MTFPQLEEYAPFINETVDGWVRAMGLTFLRATPDEVVAEWDVGPQHLQAYGIVHGGVHAGVAESIASVGAALFALSRGQTVVGLENHSSFLRAVRSGRLRARALPLQRGRKTQVWEAMITDEQGQLIATARVRLLCLEPGATLSGSQVELSKKAD